MRNVFTATSLAAAAAAMSLAAPVGAAEVPAAQPAGFTMALPAAPMGANGIETAEHHRRGHRPRGNAYGHRRDSRRYNDTRQRYYGDRVTRNTRVWQGRDGRYYCRKDDGTTGLLIGAAAGALAGRELTRDRTLGTILGAAVGGLAGREIDRSNSRCR
ncbi:glycine zipper 2TM domain-containing protein [Alteriqipengyuania flavescens]|uniref:glycine zipper 2TM domain-containing protein n=1 Tax=Alteriqipengyuania flavescens TaxID=3053610 RepID=UPI0025B540C3|nr:glycine zipper 2TM domain-containing protein [Alteriqipengyuania flavescens]WJY18832.1 glycine zipper 2TM domain-containing protein [Alteriqipengyuania flavescens]WJY24772.1 glycine zipper 2TM domain-containing protein [Alteriqipengyuania flavescens]